MLKERGQGRAKQGREVTGGELLEEKEVAAEAAETGRAGEAAGAGAGAHKRCPLCPT